MHVTRRTGLTLAAAAATAAALPRFAAAQDTAAPEATNSYEVEGGQVTFHPVEHASMVIETPGGVIYLDPVGGADLYADMPPPNLILITHEHGDHYDQPTLDALGEVSMITNPAVHDMLPEAMQARANTMANGDTVEAMGMQIEAIPAHNTTEDRMQYHPEGRDNGYILTIGGKRFYIAGDTEPTPEMMALENIDVAFLPMNLPYTMTVEQAAEAVAAFKPAVVYPYHYRDSDVEEFARLVSEGDSGTQVIIGNWYPNGMES
ncbi:MBL fold metallo-hydrolase (plasmid) [Paracoccus sp. TK19116]|uniref:MBL fold metallo-hydrolase n=1 Tax=Paracoccus albicereus TaxID=2922394 RepID=A0ABT1MQ25_9RHOB|nr:MBL fold metallo-hydrolase [Paracoccus albicereus]MCQ0969468.1 MBL fold metallo-hydrolase [Paracoccus albicereus]